MQICFDVNKAYFLIKKLDIRHLIVNKYGDYLYGKHCECCDIQPMIGDNDKDSGLNNFMRSQIISDYHEKRFRHVYY